MLSYTFVPGACERGRYTLTSASNGESSQGRGVGACACESEMPICVLCFPCFLVHAFGFMLRCFFMLLVVACEIVACERRGTVLRFEPGVARCGQIWEELLRRNRFGGRGGGRGGFLLR